MKAVVKVVTLTEMYRISWKTSTQEDGNGDYVLTEEEAKFQVEEQTKKFPLTTYWYEQQAPAPLKLKNLRCSYGDTSFITQNSPILSPTSPNQPPARLNLKGHICSYGDVSFIAYVSPVGSPIENPSSPIPSQNSNNVIWSPLKLPKIKKTCSFGEVTIFEIPHMSPHQSPIS